MTQLFSTPYFIHYMHDCLAFIRRQQGDVNVVLMWCISEETRLRLRRHPDEGRAAKSTLTIHSLKECSRHELIMREHCCVFCECEILFILPCTTHTIPWHYLFLFLAFYIQSHDVRKLLVEWSASVIQLHRCIRWPVCRTRRLLYSSAWATWALFLLMAGVGGPPHSDPCSVVSLCVPFLSTSSNITAWRGCGRRYRSHLHSRTFLLVTQP